MKKIIGYLKKHNLPEIDKELTQLDLFVLSMISYLKFESLSMWGFKKIKIKQFAGIYRQNIYKKFDRSKRFVKFLELLGKNDRYRDLEISNFYSEIDDKKYSQIAAVTITLPQNRKFISFRGTDETAVGVKEDFIWAYKNDIPSHEKAKQYVESVIDKDDKFTYLLGGHSKGGNLAVYAASKISKEKQEKIESVTNLDGPGFADDFLRSLGYRRILEKIHTYIPKDSVIGLLFKRKERVSLVNSAAVGIIQHDPYTWYFKDNNFVTVREFEDGQEVGNETFDEIMVSMSSDEREDFINSFYNLFCVEKHDTVYDLVSLNRIFRVISTYTKLPKDRKKFIRKTFWLFVKAFIAPKRKWKKALKKKNKKLEKKESLQ